MMTYRRRAMALLVLLPLLGGAVLVADPPVPVLVAATMPVSPPTVPAKSFRWPLDGPPRPVRRFDPPPQPWLPGHRGVDLAAEPGVVVRAAGAGVVLFAGMVAGRPVVSVSHSAGLRTTYEPVRPGVKAGDRLRPGDPLGVLLPGHAGCPAAACLHWGLRRGDEYLDPLALLGLGRVRLLPAAGGSTGAAPSSPRDPGKAPRAARLRSAQRAGRAAAGRAGRTPRRGCRPAR
jgi:murein DD-endopeptidase MepM/ murein hydrolase activator NlpD